MAAQDMQLRKGVRAILARHWIDPDKLQVTASRGGIRLSGELCRLPAGGRRELDTLGVNQLLQELRRLPGVSRIQTADLLVLGPGGRRRPI